MCVKKIHQFLSSTKKSTRKKFGSFFLPDGVQYAYSDATRPAAGVQIVTYSSRNSLYDTMGQLGQASLHLYHCCRWLRVALRTHAPTGRVHCSHASYAYFSHRPSLLRQHPFLYKSLFTENSVATQKHRSTSINTKRYNTKYNDQVHHSSWHLVLEY